MASSSHSGGGRGPSRPKATVASNRYATTSSTSKSKFDLRNPNTLAPTSAVDEDYDAETAAILNLDEITGQSRGVKRNAVNLDGYDSDSSNEGFKGTKKGKDNGGTGAGDDDDMFGDANSEEDAKISNAEDTVNGASSKKKKDVRFLEIDEILGQEASHKTTQSESEDDEDEEEKEDDEIDEEVGPGGKKKHAPKIDSFNMKAEMEEGRFDDQGNFVRKAADEDAVHDSWLEGVSKKEMKRAKESHDKREAEAKKRRLEEDELITGDIIADLILTLERGETALEALARLNSAAPKKQKQKPKKSWQQRKKSGDMDIDSNNNSHNSDKHGKEAEDPKEIQRRGHIEQITTAADRLLSRGFNEIYDEPREGLTRMYRKETNEPWVEPPDPDAIESGGHEDSESKVESNEWEYKWSDGQGDGQIHGPYGGVEMRGWKDAGYFQEGVVFRRMGEGEADWTRLPEF